MQSTTFPPRTNPLANYMRQPKIYITLPSRGNFWPKNSLVLPETGELPVYSMTAKDELMFKTPDALMNGQAVVDVIQSCIPNIKNAWDIPTIDVDTIMIAIRLATYGERMPLKFKVPNTDEEVEYEVDLRMLLDQQQANHWIDQVVIKPEFIIFVRPLTFKHLTQTSLKTFETTRILNIVNDESIPEEKKIAMFNASFNNLTKMTVDLMSASIYKVVTEETEVTEPRFIEEFVSNADKDIFDVVQKHLNELKEHNSIKPLEFTATDEQKELGAPETFSIPLNFNESDFFARSF